MPLSKSEIKHSVRYASYAPGNFLPVYTELQRTTLPYVDSIGPGVTEKSRYASSCLLLLIPLFSEKTVNYILSSLFRHYESGLELFQLELPEA
jgi:hypothetical protein